MKRSGERQGLGVEVATWPFAKGRAFFSAGSRAFLQEEELLLAA